MAEVKAIYEGFLLCKHNGMTDLEIESDSLSAVQSFHGNINSNGELIYILRRCRVDMGSINLIYREQNVVADAFARYAHEFPGK